MPKITDSAACIACSAKWDERQKGMVPCFQAHHEANTSGQTVVTVVDDWEVGTPCVYHADWPDLANMLLQFPSGVKCYDRTGKGFTRNSLDVMSRAMKKWLGHDGRHNIQRAEAEGRKAVSYFKIDGQSVYKPNEQKYVVLIARPNDAQFLKFLGQYHDKVSHEGGYSRGEKYTWVIYYGATHTTGEISKMLRELLTGTNLACAIGVFAVFTGVMTAAMTIGGMARVLAAIASIGLTAADFMGCARQLKEAFVKTEAASSETALNNAGDEFVKFLILLAAIVVPAALGAVCKRMLHWFTKETPANVRRLEHETGSAPLCPPHADKHRQKPVAPHHKEAHEPMAPIKNRMPDRFEAVSGMWKHHLRPLKAYAREKQILFVARCGNEASLPRHFDELVTGKPMDVKWKTAHEGPHKGLVVAPNWHEMIDYSNPKEMNSFLHALAILKSKGYKFKPPAKAGRLPEPGSLLLGPDGRAFCSDVDKMGMYRVKDGHAIDHNLMTEFNNSPERTSELNRAYGSIKLDQHPGQDYFTVGVDAEGRPIMGLQPKTEEKFLVIMGDKDPPPAYVVDIDTLKTYYKLYGIRWPYER